MKKEYKMKRVLGLFLASFLCLGLAACSRDVNETSEAETAAAETEMTETEMTETSTEPVPEPLRLCVIYKGSLGDSAYNDDFAAGVYTAAEEFGLEVDALEGADEEAWESNVLAACEEGYDFVVGASPEIGEWIAKYGEEYPEIQFAVMDVDVDLPNVQSVYFSYEECYFLAGATAAKLTEMTDTEGINEDAVIGWIGGMNIPVVQTYFEAFKQGAGFVNPEIQILEEYVGSWSDVERAGEIASGQIDRGADVIVNVASAAGKGVLDNAKERGIYVIEAEQTPGTEESEHVLASMKENADRAGYLIAKGMAEETLDGGAEFELSLKDGAVGLTDFASVREILGEEAVKELQEQCQTLTDMLITGECVIGEPDGSEEPAEEMQSETDGQEPSVQNK